MPPTETTEVEDQQVEEPAFLQQEKPGPGAYMPPLQKMFSTNVGPSTETRRDRHVASFNPKAWRKPWEGEKLLDKPMLLDLEAIAHVLNTFKAFVGNQTNVTSKAHRLVEAKCGTAIMPENYKLLPSQEFAEELNEQIYMLLCDAGLRWYARAAERVDQEYASKGTVPAGIGNLGISAAVHPKQPFGLRYLEPNV